MIGYGFHSGNGMASFLCYGNRDEAWIKVLQIIYDYDINCDYADLNSTICNDIPVYILPYCNDHPLIFLMTDADWNVSDEAKSILDENIFDLCLILINGASVDSLDSSNVTIIDYNSSEQVERDIISMVSTNTDDSSSADLLVDNDEDGLSDYEELTGHLLSNGTVEFTMADKKDTDDDLLDDNIELGIARNLLSLRIANDSDFRSLFSRYSNDISCRFFFSYPSEKDKDNDNCPDNEDAYPKDKNPSIIYILSAYNEPGVANSDSHNSQNYKAKELQIRYAKLADNIVRFTGLDSTDSFIKVWDVIGLEYYDVGSSHVKKYGDKYSFSVKYVVIIAHGTKASFALGNDECICVAGYERGKKHIYIEDLIDKRIECLFLHCCYCGADVEKSVAKEFLKTQSCIGSVIAFDLFLYCPNVDGVQKNIGIWYEETDTGVMTSPDYDSIIAAHEKADKSLIKLVDEYRYAVLDEYYYSDSYEKKNGFVKYTKNYDGSISAPEDIFDDDILYGSRMFSDGTSVYEYAILIQFDMNLIKSMPENDPVLKYQ